MNDDEKYELNLILHYCNKIESHIEYFGDDREIFLTNEHYQDACALVIIQIGEHVSRLKDDFRKKYPGVPWSEIKGMRDIYAHNYEGIMHDVIWVTMKEDIPLLKNYIKSIL